jgi:hypothetical protein
MKLPCPVTADLTMNGVSMQSSHHLRMRKIQWIIGAIRQPAGH